MQESSFSHLIFWNNPISSLCFFAFAMSFITLWIRKTAWLWGSFLFIAYLLAFQAKIAGWLSLIPILILLICHIMLNREVSKGSRFLLFSAAVATSFALGFHFLPGFHNWHLVSNETVSPGAYPYNLWLNFDKPFMGIFALALGIPLIASRAQLIRVFKLALPMTVLGILIIMGITLHFNLVAWNPKIPVFFFVWFFDNLIFVSIAEEAFFRGFLQKELFRWFGGNSAAAFASVCATSLFFTLLHLFWVADLPFLCVVFVTSIIYGTIYQVTRSIKRASSATLG